MGSSTPSPTSSPSPGYSSSGAQPGSDTRWPTAPFIGLLLIGWGSFNLVEGVVDHLVLGIHHLNETVPREQWIWWDPAFLVWGVAMVVIGWWLLRTNRVEHEQEASGPDVGAGFPLRTDIDNSQSLIKPRPSRPGIAQYRR